MALATGSTGLSLSSTLARVAAPKTAASTCVFVAAARRQRFSTTPQPREDELQPAETGRSARPRWSYTPEGLKGPGFSINIVKDPRRKIWAVNEDPGKLDAMYVKLFGQSGDKVLPDEIKWLAVTHKSFDQGRRGYNTKLAYYGRLILSLEATRSIVTSPIAPPSNPRTDPFGREPFSHPSLANVDKLNYRQPHVILDKARIAQLSYEIGLDQVMRWKPRLPENLGTSGITGVLNTTFFAIVGAVALQQGSEVAGRLVRDKILKRLTSR